MNTKSVVLKKFRQLLEVKYSGSTPATYEYQVGLFLDHASNVPDRVNNEDILNYNIHIRHTSNSNINVAINAIKAYFELYLRKKVKNYAAIRPPKQHRAVPVFNYSLMVDQIKAIENIKHRLILSLGLGGWLRVGEVLNLKLNHLDKDTSTISIKNSKGCKDRVIVISTSLLNLIITYYREYLPKNYLIEGQSQDKYSSSSVNQLINKYLGKKYRFHNLRSAGAAYAHQNGMSIYDISHRLGHRNIETTKYYIPINQNPVPSEV